MTERRQNPLRREWTRVCKHPARPEPDASRSAPEGGCDDQARAPAQAGTGVDGLSHSTILALQQRGIFPQSIKIGPKATGWYEDEVQNCIETRPRTGETGPGRAADRSAAQSRNDERKPCGTVAIRWYSSILGSVDIEIRPACQGSAKTDSVFLIVPVHSHKLDNC